MDIISVEKRNEKAAAKRLRRDGILPCNVYGGALKEAVSIQMDMQKAVQLCRTKRIGSTVRLEMDGKQVPVQIKDVVNEPVSGALQHISFQALTADQRVNSVAQILLKNAEAVPGVLEQAVFEVPYSALPADMIDTVTIDLEGKPVGTFITVSDIPEFQSDRVELRIDADSMVLRILDKPRAEPLPEDEAAAD